MATAQIFLDSRYSKADNKKLTVKFCLNHKGKSTFIATSIKLFPSQWNKVTKKVKGHPEKVLLNQTLSYQLNRVTTILTALTISGEAALMDVSELRNEVVSRMYDDFSTSVIAEPKNAPSPNKTEKSDNPRLVENVFKRYIDLRINNKRTADIYEVTLRKIEAFSGKKFSNLEVGDISYGWLEDFERFLKQTAPSANARAIHLRNLRAIINYALKLDLIDKYVFRNFTIKTEKTKKRNMSVEALRRVIHTELEPWMEKYRDFFVLSFLFRGLNTVDLCALPKPVNGRIEWMRTKTHQPLSLKIEPEMMPYIKRWSGNKLLLEHCDTGRPYRNFNDMLTKNLHEIVKYINYQYQDDIVVPDITMYWGRHTWATIASSLRIPLDTIGCALGHSQKSVTEIYVERDPSLVDEANRAVIDWVFYNIKNGVVVAEETEEDCEEEPRYKIIMPRRKRGRPKKEWRQEAL